MNEPSEQWTATQLRVLRASGLASSHCQPFTRLLYRDPKTRHGKAQTFLVESRDSDSVNCQHRRERNGKVSAKWTDSELFNVHSTVNWVELQLWNRFDNGFDVFLGKVSVSLHQLRLEAKASGDSATGGLWFPLQTPEANGLGSYLSLEVECVFSSDPKVVHIREEMKRRKKEKHRPKGEASGEEEETNNSVVDPVFAFTRPFLPVDWSLVAATNVRQLFFHSDVERLAAFRDVVLYSNLEQELESDEGLQIDEAHVEAFKACQFSAQYLDHCVASLSERLDLYTEDYRGLHDTRKQLARGKKSLTAQRKRLRKEHDDLELLIAAYRRVLDVTPPSDHLEQPNSPVRDSLPVGSPPISPTSSISSKKPQFLQTWEERERERRLEKETSKAQRIQQEQQRLNQRALERQQREDYEAFVAKVKHSREQRAARRLQLFYRHLNQQIQSQRRTVETQAATLVQTAWRRFVLVREYPHRLETKKQQSERQLMAQNEREMRGYLDEMSHKRALSPPESVQSEEDAPPPSKQVVDALVATWKKLRRVFVLANRVKGVRFRSLFAALDLRQDDVIDRAELRLGARSFNVRLDRKMTRALIALVRTKCGVPSKPLLVTFEHFLAGFELVEAPVDPLEETSVLVPSVSEETKHIGTVRSDLEDKQQPETTEDELEALVATVRALRSAIYESVSSFLAATGKAPSDFRAFREALVGIFSRLDVDGNGQLDVEELVACVASFKLQLSSEKVSLLRELFVGDRESDRVGVAEFISFVLAEPSTDDELGLVGHKIRQELATRVRAQAQTNSIEDAVRLVLGTHRKDQSCSIPAFVRALNRLRLDLTPTQLARLVVRLDRDGDRSISFDEVLLWLRLRSEPLADEIVSERRTVVEKAMEKAEGLRLLLDKLASNTDLTALFRRIDRDNSGKINQEELHEFLRQQDLASIQEISQLCQVSASQDPAALVAQEMMDLLDLNRNGVVTLKEWLTVALYEPSQADDPVVIESMRKALKESEKNDPECLVNWFSELPGVLRVPTEPQQLKVRVAEFKTALRAKLGGRSVSLQTIDRVVRGLDSDSSGWITTSELSAWAYPPRDLEELLRLVKKCWQSEYELSREDLAATLYQSFDVDGNGSLAVRELREGFMAFGLSLSEYEARVVLISFDLDGDGCWSKAEFLAFVMKLSQQKNMLV
ncbi:hypothetical protein DVH05_001266 [Phytophthora capsici]|nr:hypothetical protein DVH05_001266 [Phytophthora capsici]